MYVTTTPVDEQLSAQKAKQVQLKTKERENRHSAVYRLADIASTLARLRLPFRGHHESESSTNRGVFKEITELVGRYDDVLHTHLEAAKKNPRAVPSYTSAKSQNEMIGCLGKEVRGQIITDVNEATFFSVCLDTTPDVSKQDQISVILRFVDKNGKVQECLLDMVYSQDATGAGLANSFFETLEKYSLEVTNIRGQGYDGCAAMSGVYRGVQALVKQRSAKAYFVHCFAYRLNLVVIDVCCKNVPCRNFFGVVEPFYCFMEGSTKRHSLFFHVQKEMEDTQHSRRPMTLKALSGTRWAARIDNCRVLLMTLGSVVKTLNRIQTSPEFDRETAGTALALRKATDFEFCFKLVAMNAILNLTGVLSKYLQTVDLDINAAAHLVEDCKSELSVLRTNDAFDKLWNDAGEVASKIEVEFEEKRFRKVSKKVDRRWQNQKQMSLKEEMKLCEYYQGDVNPKVAVMEYKLLTKRLQRQEPPVQEIMAIYLFLVEQNLLQAYPEISKLYKLIITLL
ncbi:hypothetical protein ABVT39_013459, partial [Epinephelus coioides]